MKRIHRVLRMWVAVLLVTGGWVVVGSTEASASFTFGQSSNARPGIAYAGATLYVSWAGTDAAQSLNIGALSFDADHAFNGWASVNTMTPLQVYAGTGPSITAAQVDGYTGDQIIVAWSDINGQINLGHYLGTKTLSCHVATGQFTHHSPYLIGIGKTVYLAWAGTDAAQHVNILKLSSDLCTSSGRSLVTLTDTANAGPTLTTDGTSIYVAWPGTGSAENLYAGRYVGTPTLAAHTCLCSYRSADDLGFTISYLDHPMLTYRGTDNTVYRLWLDLSSTSIGASGQGSGGHTNHGVDVTAVPDNNNIPTGMYDSFVDSANGQPTFDWVGE